MYAIRSYYGKVSNGFQPRSQIAEIGPARKPTKMAAIAGFANRRCSRSRPGGVGQRRNRARRRRRPARSASATTARLAIIQSGCTYA